MPKITCSILGKRHVQAVRIHVVNLKKKGPMYFVFCLAHSKYASTVATLSMSGPPSLWLKGK